MSEFNAFANTIVSEVYDERVLSRQQIQAGITTIQNFNSSLIRWQVLLAQMQSGKTETFLFIAAEMIRLCHIEHAIIFSGNAETDLKNQLVKEVEGRPGSKFWGRYDLFLDEEIRIRTRERGPIIEKIKLNIQVVWGIELNKYSGYTENSLFIWEESHHAQSLKQCPDKFLRQVGISADGDESILRAKNNFVLSVSATPFSEMCDKINLEQSKEIVTMEPGSGYNSVKKMSDRGKIKFYSDVKQGLISALGTPHVGYKYAIVRIGPKNEEFVKQVIRDNGWSFVIFDSISDDPQGKATWDNMINAPQRDTVILLRNKCRMGKNLEKTHVLFCFETAKKSRTDTVLQGLLGRVCGYSANSENVDVYLSDKIQRTGEIERYIQMTNGQNVVPKRAINLKGSGIISNRMPVSIMKIDRENITCHEDRAGLKADIVAAFNTNVVENYNNPEIFNIIKSVVDNPETKFLFHGLDRTNETYAQQNISEKFAISLRDRTPFHGVNGCGFNSTNPLQVNVWIVENVDELRRGDVFIDCYVPAANPVTEIPMTTKREVFAHKLEDERTAISNGSFQIYLDPETAASVNKMEEDLKYICGLYLTARLSTSNSVCSNQDSETGERVGIYVTMEVLASLEKRGQVYETIKQELGLTIKICKARGCVPKAIKDRGMIRLASISW
jgi:hypothetical protein